MRSLWLLTLALSTLPAMASVEQQLANCATISDKLDRLICYDKLAETAARAPVLVPAAAVAAAPTTSAATISKPAPTMEESFGKTQKAEEEPDRIELEIADVDKDQYGNLKISFTNGQVWKQTDSRRYKLTTGEKIFIEKGALSSFYLGSDSRNSTIRVKRIN
ncbi:hypothetical protein [Shewanella sp.]|uniref:hypothetical protein n=1 Tax=Shewanella sp. TaxID=50422 RepID=UPI003568F8A9